MLQKTFTLKNIIFVGIIVGLIIALAQMDSCYNSKFNAQKKSYDSAMLANQELHETVNKLNQKIYKQEVIITDNKNQLLAEAKEIFQLKKKDEGRIKQINALIQIKTKTSVDSVEIAYVDTAARRRFTDSVEKACADVIAYYRTHTVELTDTTSSGEPSKHVSIDSTKDKDFQFDGDILADKFRINNINFPDSQTIAIVETKGGFFRRDIKGKLKFYTKPKMEIMVLHTNKYIKVSGMSSRVYQPKIKGRWGERALIFGAGFVAGVLLTK